MFLLQMEQEGHDLCLYGHVERRGRLVAEEYVWMYRHRARDRGTLAFAAAHLMRIAMRVGCGQSHLGEEGCDAFLRAAPVGTAQAADGLADHGADRAAWVERAGRVLKHHLHTRIECAPIFARCAGDVRAAQQNAPARRRMQSREELCNG